MSPRPSVVRGVGKKVLSLCWESWVFQPALERPRAWNCIPPWLWDMKLGCRRGSLVWTLLNGPTEEWTRGAADAVGNLKAPPWKGRAGPWFGMHMPFRMKIKNVECEGSFMRMGLHHLMYRRESWSEQSLWQKWDAHPLRVRAQRHGYLGTRSLFRLPPASRCVCHLASTLFQVSSTSY